MRRSTRPARLLAALALTAVSVAGCGKDNKAIAPEYADQLRSGISVDALMAHVKAFARIADEHGGTRETGSPGYAASAQYVTDALRSVGFDVQQHPFELGVFRVRAESLTIGDVAIPARTVEYSAATVPSGVTGPLLVLRPGRTTGCAPSDYDGLTARGAVVVADRGVCELSEKAALAAERDAVGLVIVSDVDEKSFAGALLESDRVEIPVQHVGKRDGETLRRQPGSATMVVDAVVDQVISYSVTAQTKTGSTDDVVMVGAHLDSIRSGPGIDDNASGVAAVLETALRMRSSPPVANAVRFAFFGGGEEGLVGSTAYARGLDIEALTDIALYVNADTVGSPNPRYRVLDGNATTPVDPGLGFGAPPGSADVERALVDALARVNITTEDLPFDGRGDWNPFARAYIPVGALCTGRTSPRDDTLANVNPAALAVSGPAIAWMAGHYAQDLTGDYGVPARADRERMLVTP